MADEPTQNPESSPQNPEPAPQSTAAGWFPDPSAPNLLRYWDGSAWTAHTSPAQPTDGSPVPQAPSAVAESAPGTVGAPLASYQGPPVLITTMNDLPGYEIEEVYGEVFGLIVRARNAFSNIGASFRTFTGGEAKGYTKLLHDSRLEATARLRDSAQQVGANAIIAMRFDCNEVADIMSEVAAYGTAVKVRKLDGSASASQPSQ
jgi:uncharacterized protein YbjQ (UPF0145 family)